MLNSTDRLIIEDIRRVNAARLAGPAGVMLVQAGKTSPAHLRMKSYRRWGGVFSAGAIGRGGGLKFLRAAAALADAGVDLDKDGPEADPRWAELLATRPAATRPARNRESVKRATVDPAASRAEVVEDIIRVTSAAGLAPPAPLSFPKYQELGGIHSSYLVRAHGGWEPLRDEAGFTQSRPGRPSRSQIQEARALQPDALALRRLVIGDVARVATECAAMNSLVATSNGLSKDEYLAAGGRYSAQALRTVMDAEGWVGLCREAGVKPPGPRFRRSKWPQKAARAKARKEARAEAGAATEVNEAPAAPAASAGRLKADIALDRFINQIRPPHWTHWMMGNQRGPWRWRRRPPEVTLRAELDRDEILADLRLVARSAGVPVARMTLETYLASGGRYSADDLRALGGFVSACQAAAARAA